MDDLFIVECNETESLSLVFQFVDRHLKLDYGSELRKISFYVIVCNLLNKAPNEDLSSACFGFLRIDFLSIDQMFTCRNNLFQCGCVVKDNKCKTSGSTGGWIRLECKALNTAIFREIISEILFCGFPT